MPFLFLGLVLGLMILANRGTGGAASGALSKAGALRRHTSEPIYDIGEEVLVPRYSDWGVVETARPMNGGWVYGVAISHGIRVRVQERDLAEP